MKKPNWTPLELLANIDRHEKLIETTHKHYKDCMCSDCIERGALYRATAMFTEEDVVKAIDVERESNKQRTIENGE